MVVWGPVMASSLALPLRDSEPTPPLLVKLTGYRILFVVLTVAFVAAKAILTYQGQPAATTLDWVLGGVIGIGQVLYSCD